MAWYPSGSEHKRGTPGSSRSSRTEENTAVTTAADDDPTVAHRALARDDDDDPTIARPALTRDRKTHVTENTVWLRNEYENDFDAQAATFRAIVETLIQHSGDGVVTWNAWQIRDTETERPERKACLFDADGNLKKAYYAVQAELQKLASDLSSRH